MLDQENEYGKIRPLLFESLYHDFYCVENVIADQLDMNVQQMDDEVDIVMNEGMGEAMDVNNDY